jgi:hypothetical protein
VPAEGALVGRAAVLGLARDGLGGDVRDVGDWAGVEEGFGVRHGPGTLVEHRGLTSMLVPGGVASSRPGRCQRPERCGAPGAVLPGLGSRALRDLAMGEVNLLTQR